MLFKTKEILEIGKLMSKYFPNAFELVDSENESESEIRYRTVKNKYYLDVVFWKDRHSSYKKYEFSSNINKALFMLFESGVTWETEICFEPNFEGERYDIDISELLEEFHRYVDYLENGVTKENWNEFKKQFEPKVFSMVYLGEKKESCVELEESDSSSLEFGIIIGVRDKMIYEKFKDFIREFATKSVSK